MCSRQDGEEWIVNGQKVWTSGGQIADMGMLIARTERVLGLPKEPNQDKVLPFKELPKNG